MNFQDITNKLKQILNEEQLNEMAIKQGRILPQQSTPIKAVNKVLKDKKSRYTELISVRPDREVMITPDPDTCCCQTTYKLFTYNGKDYYFGILWGEEDTKHPKTGTILQGHGLAHILINHRSNFETLIHNLNLAITAMKPENIFKDKKGNLEIDVNINKMKFVFKNYKELNDNYFYLHTAY